MRRRLGALVQSSCMHTPHHTPVATSQNLAQKSLVG